MMYILLITMTIIQVKNNMENNINTIFKVNGEHYEVRGSGQQAASDILARFRVTKVILAGFLNKETNIFTPAKF